MASSRRTRRRRKQRSFQRHQLRLEGLEKRYALNSAPVLDPTYDPTFNVVTENSGAPVGQVGTSITSLINTEGSDGSSFSDPDGDAPGIAITETNLLGGTLWVSYDDGEIWSDLGPVDQSNPELLVANNQTLLYFQPAENFHGQITDVITFKAWDRHVSYESLGQQLYGQSSGELFGRVALSQDGKVMVVGAPESDINGEASGNVRVYRQDNNQWQQIGETLHGLPGDKFGSSVSISDDGNIIAVGARYGESGTNNAVGYVSIFRQEPVSGIPEDPNPVSNYGYSFSNKIFGQVTNELSGFVIDLSGDGNRLAVSALYGSQNLGGDVTGSVRVYDFVESSSSWSQVKHLVGRAAGDQFGWSIDLSNDGRTLAVGAHYNDAYGIDAGLVDVYREDGSGNWEQMGGSLGTSEPGQRFGNSVSLTADGNRLAVGALWDQEGRVDVYDFYSNSDAPVSNDSWSLVQSLYGEAMSDLFGKQVQLSDDGQYMIVGAYLNDFEGDAAGKIYTYNLIKNNPTSSSNMSSYALATYMHGEVSGEQFGMNVSMSGNGFVVAGNAPTSDVIGTDSGVVRALQATSAVNSLSTETDTVSVVVSETEAALNFQVSFSENHLRFTWDSYTSQYVTTGYQFWDRNNGPCEVFRHKQIHLAFPASSKAKLMSFACVRLMI